MKRFSLFLFALPALLFADKDPANYPLKVHILQQNWSSHNVRYNDYRATGRGNLWEGDSIHAFDFTYDCSFGLTRTARNQPYFGKWKTPQRKLALLALKIGKKNNYQECTLNTTVREGVYIIGNGGITEMSQEDFKAWRAKHAEDRTAQAAAGAPSKVSIASAPDSAEIEVDGEFMGNTPSTLELDAGEHNIAIRKPGYKPWEKKLKVTAGDVNLNAELEPETR